MRRLRLPLPLVSRTCRCGRLLDSFGHHRAACSRAGVLERRGFAVESVGARIFREAGARVATNVLVRDLVPNVHDGRAWRLWLKACHCSMGSSWWWIPLWSVHLRGDGSPRPNAAVRQCRSPGCQAPQGAHIPRVGGAACASSVGCLGWRSWWAVVW